MSSNPIRGMDIRLSWPYLIHSRDTGQADFLSKKSYKISRSKKHPPHKYEALDLISLGDRYIWC